MRFIVAVAVTLAITRDVQLALAIGVIEPIVQTVAFAIHERLWSMAGTLKAGTLKAGIMAPPPECAHTALGSLLNQEVNSRRG